MAEVTLSPQHAAPLAWAAAPAVPAKRSWPLGALAIGCFLCWFLIDDWIASLAILLLWAIWRFLPAEEGPPVLSMALTFQWAQASIGIFYHGLTGHPMEAIERSDYRPMVLMSLGSVAALLLGLALALRLWRRPFREMRPTRTFGDRSLFALYLGFLVGLGLLQTFAWRIPGITQGILALGFLRLVVLYLLFRRLSGPPFRWTLLLPLLAFEVGLGFTGYFASFREPLVLLVLVLVERFDRRKMRNWLVLGATLAAVVVTALLWLSIRTTYRQDFEIEAFASSRSARLERVVDLSRGWFSSGSQSWENIDSFVERLWAIYYPALAVSRVPNILPHEDGRILLGAVRHVLMPRLFFPNKGSLLSDSEMVRKYSGVWVAGADEGTSIAFGYVAESYIDFGLPYMFVPMFVFAFLMGLAYRRFLRLIWYRELAVGLVTVVFWLSLYLFERSWVKTLGLTITLMVVMGAAVFILDRLLLLRRTHWLRRRGLSPTFEALASLDQPVPLAPLVPLAGRPGPG